MYAGKVTRKATYKKAGVRTYTCKLCKATKTEAIPKLNKTVVMKMKANGKKGFKLVWNKADGADGYDIFFSKCDGRENKVTKKIKTLKGNTKFSWTVRKLKKNTAYKAFVRAWTKKNGKKTYFTKSLTVHAFTSGGTRKYTNPKNVKVNRASVTLDKGKTFKIKAKVTKLNKKKILIPKSHAVRLRYMSTDTATATVSRSGMIKAVGKGSCKVYAISVNGVYKVISVTVK